MITEFKMFENSDDKITIILNDVIDYFNSDDDSIRNFIFKLLDYNNKNIVEFDCKKCTMMINGATNFIHSNKHHKGIIRGRGYGFNRDFKYIYLTLTLKRIKYDHDVDTDSPTTIYGYVPDGIKKIVNDINIKREANKFNK